MCCPSADMRYVATGSTLLKFDAQGNKAASLALNAPVSASPFIAYDSGMVFAFVSDGENGCVQAIDAETMQGAWVSEPLPGMECFSPITVSDGSLYLAVSGYDYAAFTVMPGMIVSMTTADEDPAAADETKALALRLRRGAQLLLERRRGGRRAAHRGQHGGGRCRRSTRTAM